MKSKLFFTWAAITLALLAYGTYQGLVVAPTEATMGDAQRIFYYHVPAAVTGFSLFTLNCIASIIYLWKRAAWADALAVTGAEAGIVFFGVLLATGPIWARYAWGRWWVWDARLSTSLILWLLYVSYLVLRRSSEAGSTNVLAACLAIVASIDMPIVYMSNRWFRTNHPQPVFNDIDPRMGRAMMWNIFAFLAFGILIAWFRYDLERMAQRISSVFIARTARGNMAMMMIPAMFLFAGTFRATPRTYLVGAYIVVWTIYISYLLFLISKRSRLKREEAEMGAG